MYPKTVSILFVVFPKDLYSNHFFSYSIINDLFKVPNTLMELIFADDTNLFLSHKDIDTLFNSTMWNLQVSQRGLSQTNSL